MRQDRGLLQVRFGFWVGVPWGCQGGSGVYALTFQCWRPCLHLTPRGSGFKNSQPDACGTPVGSCLGNQIYDLYAQELVRMAAGGWVHAEPPALFQMSSASQCSGQSQHPSTLDAGLDPLYFVGRYGGGANNTQQARCTRRCNACSPALPPRCKADAPLRLCPAPLPALQMTSASGPNGSLQLSLNLPLPAIQTSLVTLSVAADDVEFVVNRCPADIVSVQVRGCLCGMV